MAELQRISPQWADRYCIIAAPGPSLTPGVVRQVRIARIGYGWKVLLVQDAYRAMKYADALYGCNPSWWHIHKDCDGFTGEKWTTHESHPDHNNDKLWADPALGGKCIADVFGVKVVKGAPAGGFSLDPEVIHYGSNSGFQAINLAILFGCKKIVLVGYDMRYVGGQAHFFGAHPKSLQQNTDQNYRDFVRHYEHAAKALPQDIVIINATPGSALTCFPMMSLQDVLSGASSPPANFSEVQNE